MRAPTRYLLVCCRAPTPALSLAGTAVYCCGIGAAVEGRSRARSPPVRPFERATATRTSWCPQVWRQALLHAARGAARRYLLAKRPVALAEEPLAAAASRPRACKPLRWRPPRPLMYTGERERNGRAEEVSAVYDNSHADRPLRGPHGAAADPGAAASRRRHSENRVGPLWTPIPPGRRMRSRNRPRLRARFEAPFRRPTFYSRTALAQGRARDKKSTPMATQPAEVGWRHHRPRLARLDPSSRSQGRRCRRAGRLEPPAHVTET